MKSMMTSTTKKKADKRPNYRKDLVTRTKLPKEALLRIVKQNNGEIHLDWFQNLPGRGAYIAKDLQALKVMAQKNLLARAFKMKINPEVYQLLEVEFQNGPQ
ncbi:hypothetical protein JN01_0696 [Entomoplasma freundtii]|uniref:RNA-binding protein n=1 Tax=Entomoplasma freundtii TaxID=74700 RepID=A0A2K8NRL6_9MOLU|nr:YlxR family protein [Entomoplasma freundtii]ATZ16480.1 RNA-binding protein [Entomoplasma freundtii]TDY56009.1 hypothetical protein JN01_0696 [Entomoplasma freundtii]